MDVLDNDRLSASSPLISPETWKRLDWKNFEELTRAYFADVLRDATWAHFAPPKRGPDGGRDVEIYIDTPIGGNIVAGVYIISVCAAYT